MILRWVGKGHTCVQVELCLLSAGERLFAPRQGNSQDNEESFEWSGLAGEARRYMGRTGGRVAAVEVVVGNEEEELGLEKV